MKYLKLIVLASISLYTGCEKDTTDGPTPDDTPVYIQDNLFGCDQFEVMETEASFPINVEPCLEVFNEYFVYEDLNGLVIKDGFNGPSLQTYDMDVQDMMVFNNDLMICASEGVYRLDASGVMSTITEAPCFSMTLDGQGRLLLHGFFEHAEPNANYDICEFKNNTIVSYAAIPSFFQCLSVTLEGGSDQLLYAISCENEIAGLENGVVRTELDNGMAPIFAPMEQLILHGYYNEGLFVITQDIYRAFRMYKLVDREWRPFYNLSYENRDTEKGREVFAYVDENILIHNGFLYAFNVGGDQSRPWITRYDVSGEEEKSWSDIDLIEIPGLASREIVDIIVAIDGSAYAVMTSKQIVKLTCD